MTRQIALALMILALTACSPSPRSACEGIVYKESGLTREQFRPCASEMVEQLDRAHAAIELMADKSRRAAARMTARNQCLAATSDLTRLLRSAGGTEKLTARWDDSRLNELSLAVIGARDYYAMLCFYGPKPFDQPGSPENSERDAGHDEARRILAEIQ